MKPGDKMGFPEGVAEKLLLRNFRRYEQSAKSAVAQREVRAAPGGAMRRVGALARSTRASP
eukprot:5713492-Prymnesium_polylepis.1